jgi:hypothetical protein
MENLERTLTVIEGAQVAAVNVEGEKGKRGLVSVGIYMRMKIATSALSPPYPFILLFPLEQTC